jgi:hypothetical protein
MPLTDLRKKNNFFARIIQKLVYGDGRLVSEYHTILQGGGDIVQWLCSNRRVVETVHGRNLVYEFILNLRSRSYGNNHCIMNMFMKYIATKQKNHNSDIAIACNIMRNYELSPEQDTYIIEFISSRIPLPESYNKLKKISLKKRLLIETAKDLKIIVQ